jgi:hypothetical protein
MAEPFHRYRADERTRVEQRLEPLHAEITALRLHGGEGA